MAVFRNNPEQAQQLDWRILQNGWVSLYWRMPLLNKDIEWFSHERYTVIDFSCSTWDDLSAMHRQLKSALDFPDYYGANYAALSDCLSELEIAEPGLVVVFRHLDQLDKKTVYYLLDVFALNARRWMLFGKRLIVLAQVNDPDYTVEPLGACQVLWNDAEWLDANRRE